jgi:CheY-like chemotaxis protein/HPt (histidine-containing phosphotransfer) domain-containing protein
MGGEISLASREGVGTTLGFRCAFPVGDAAEIEAIRAQAVSRVAGRRPPTRELALAEGSLVLLIEDHPTNRLVLGQQLQLAGFALDMAIDGHTGFDMWRHARYGVVFTDLHMPGMSGNDVVRAIREAERGDGRPRTPVLALTAAALREEMESCLAAGMDDVVVKPTTVPILAAKLRRWLPALPWQDVGGDAAADATRAETAAAHTALNPEVLRELTGGDAASLQAILKDFRESTGKDLHDLANQIMQRDAQSVTRNAHRLKGASLIVGAAELAGVSQELEAASKREDWEAITGLCKKMRAAFGRVEHEMRDLR